MAKVYLSSTVLDLKNERRAVSDWLIAAGHQPVHSYVADSETVRESCLADIDACDLYVLILGHRYGYVLETDNPEGLSITHMEFRRAGELGLPRIALMRTSVPDIAHSDLLNAERNQRMQAFHAEVRQAVRPAEFKDDAELIGMLSTGVQRALAKSSGTTETTEPVRREPRPSPPPVGNSGTSGNRQGGANWWMTLPGMLTAGAAFITAVTGLAALFMDDEPKPAVVAPVANGIPATPAAAPVPISAPTPASQSANLPRYEIDGAGEVRFEQPYPSTYSVLSIASEPRGADSLGLRFHIRLLNRSRYPINFWDAGFRLLIDGVPAAPDSGLNVVVDGNAANQADITFPTPRRAGQLALRILHSDDQVADLPLRLATGEASAPVAGPSQRVEVGTIGSGAQVNIQQSQ